MNQQDQHNLFRSIDQSADFTFSGKRTFPPLGMTDTIDFSGSLAAGFEVAGTHEMQAPFIDATQIIRINAFHENWSPALEVNASPYQLAQKNTGPKYLESGTVRVPIYCSQNEAGRSMHLIPQMAQRSCCFASAAMLILDFCAENQINKLESTQIFEKIKNGSIKNSAEIPAAINKVLGANKQTIIFNQQASWEKIESALKIGPLAISVDHPTVEGHLLVLDSIFPEDQKTLARIRDPYHAWDITISFETLKQLTGRSIETVQIRICG